jgi:Arc-like DNA binding domain
MPKTTRGIGSGKRHPLNMRTTKETRDRLEASAIANGRSLAQEVESRLERSFEQDDRFGGEAMLGIANMLIGAFVRGGQFGAAASGHPDWAPNQWVNDPFCYRAAAYSVGFALNLPLPTEAPMDDPARVHELLTGMIARGVPITRTEGSEK